ncbi:response regulator transcription factor [Bradyrhizobium lablabi]|uniref:response regulator n=1 Tax=Bradyrhizobium lablabi TaxID=722472 RepID=UPI001BAB9040|nr:response regulator transcription factor [Bradyrhizobium lablabi]MBR0696692.1 response regulator transcription factor [Bradyrhizobium lablabi]
MIRIFIADDHTIFREGLKQMLAEEADFKIAGEATNGDELLAQLASSSCDIVLLDLTMPGRSGISLLRELAANEKWRVIVLSMHEEDQYIVEALKAGAAGYVTKNSAFDQLILAIRKVVKGELFISSAASQSLIRQARAPSEPLPHTRLTPREREVFDLLVLGRKMSDIARQLGLSIKTASTHKTNLLNKMQAETTADLVRYALRHQLDPRP